VVVKNGESKPLSGEQIEKVLDAVRTWVLHATVLPKNEEWKLEQFYRENPGLAPKCNEDTKAS
jgi:hypothetical protein